MSKDFAILLAAFILSIPILAQDKKIESDRPGETQTVSITEKGYFQLEAGFQKEWQKIQDYSLLNPDALIKYGLSKHIEIRAEIMAETDKLYSKHDFRYGLMPLELGLKAQLSDEKGFLPAVSFLGNLGLPRLAAKDHKTDHLPAELRLLFENTLQEKLKLNYNIGCEWDGEDSNPDWMYSVSPQLDISDKFSLFVEEYGFVHKGEKPKHYLDGGFDYYISRNIKFDLYGGIGISAEASDYFISSGISFRFKP